MNQRIYSNLQQDFVVIGVYQICTMILSHTNYISDNLTTGCQVI